MKYDLTAEPWIYATRTGNTTAFVGLREALGEAHHLRAIQDPLPTVEFGIYRLLVAFALDAFFLEPGIALDTRSLGELYHIGYFDPARLDAYFAAYSQSLDLFGPRPFLQTAGMGGADKPLAGLLPPVPSGINTTHFHHGQEGVFAVAPDAAARLLTSIASFMTAGGRGDGGQGQSPSINGAPPFYVLVTGSSLFETLCRNLCALDLRLSAGDEPPAWRSTRTVGGARCKGASYAQSLTWQPRRLRLVPSEGGTCSLTGRTSPVLIRTMKFGPGDSCDFGWEDPNCAYRFDGRETDPAKVRKIMRPRPGREIWRDTGPLALLREGDQGSEDGLTRFQRPRVLDQLPHLGGEAGFGLTVYGMRTDLKMKVFEWQRERLDALDAPSGLVLRTGPTQSLQSEAKQGMDRADKAALVLRRVIKIAFPREGGKNESALRAAQDAAERDYWRILRGSYRDLLNELVGLDDADFSGLMSAREGWKAVVNEAATVAARPALDGYDTDGSIILRQARALSELKRGLRRTFETQQERRAREERKKERDKAARAAAKPPREKVESGGPKK